MNLKEKFKTDLNVPRAQHNNKSFEVMGITNPETYDYKEIGIMYEIKVDTGEIINVLPEEIFYFNFNKKNSNEYERRGKELGAFLDEKVDAYGSDTSVVTDVFKVFMEQYKEKDKYIIPEELLNYMFLTVRILDKIGRIMSNPKMDKMNENPMKDIAGYGLLGSKLNEI